jgi:hypothetical protein
MAFLRERREDTMIEPRIHEENELRRAWHEPDLAHALDVVGRPASTAMG